MELALVVDQVLNRGKMECISARGPICQSAVIQLKMCITRLKVAEGALCQEATNTLAFKHTPK
jgi:hypothetical protein